MIQWIDVMLFNVEYISTKQLVIISQSLLFLPVWILDVEKVTDYKLHNSGPDNFLFVYI